MRFFTLFHHLLVFFIDNPELSLHIISETTTEPWSGEPCETPHVLNEIERHYTATIGKEAIDDRKLKASWYKVEYQGSPAIITSQAIKVYI